MGPGNTKLNREWYSYHSIIKINKFRNKGSLITINSLCRSLKTFHNFMNITVFKNFMILGVNLGHFGSENELK